MAISVNAVLSACYHATFGGSSGSTEEDELMLVTAPLSAASEVQGLYEKGVIDYESALPAALHSLGCSANEITEALKRRRSQQDTRGLSETAALESQNAVRAAQAEHTRAGIPLVAAQTEKVKADIELSAANAYKAKKDADRDVVPTAVAGGDQTRRTKQLSRLGATETGGREGYCDESTATGRFDREESKTPTMQLLF
eukprot:2904564-Prymnesium_polylepis.1